MCRRFFHTLAQKPDTSAFKRKKTIVLRLLARYNFFNKSHVKYLLVAKYSAISIYASGTFFLSAQTKMRYQKRYRIYAKIYICII